MRICFFSKSVTSVLCLFTFLAVLVLVSPCVYAQQSQQVTDTVTESITDKEVLGLYTINPLDEVSIVVYAGEKQINEYRKYVQSDGTIYLPFLEKDIKIGGMKVLDAQKILEDIAQKYVKSPRIVITVSSSFSQSVSTYGKIDNRTIDLKTPMRILQLIARTGGPKEGARSDSIRVISRDGDVKIFNYDRVNKNPNDKNNFYLKPGDIVYVPDEDNMSVIVLGDVMKAGIYPIKDNKHVIDALLKAGSWSITADIKKVRLVRNVGGKAIYIKKIDITKFFNDGDMKQNYLLSDGDMIYVPTKKGQEYVQKTTFMFSMLATLATTYSVIYSINH